LEYLIERKLWANIFNSAHCTLANFIQVTLFDASSDIKAQMTFSGSSVEPTGFDCETFIGGIQSAIGGIPLPDIAEGVISGVSAICSLVTG
jgi:cell wall-associated NlpC family hydrolase